MGTQHFTTNAVVAGRLHACDLGSQHIQTKHLHHEQLGFENKIAMYKTQTKGKRMQLNIHSCLISWPLSLLRSFPVCFNSAFFPISRSTSRAEIHHPGNGAPTADRFIGALRYRHFCHHWPRILQWCFSYCLSQTRHRYCITLNNPEQHNFMAKTANS